MTKFADNKHKSRTGSASNIGSPPVGSSLQMETVKPRSQTAKYGPRYAPLFLSVINLSAGCATLPVEVLEKAAKDFVNTAETGCSVAEMGYRTRNFHVRFILVNTRSVEGMGPFSPKMRGFHENNIFFIKIARSESKRRDFHQKNNFIVIKKDTILIKMAQFLSEKTRFSLKTMHFS